jgi:hypothetical protein
MNLRQRIEQRITDLRVERDIAAAALTPAWFTAADLRDGDDGFGFGVAKYVASLSPASTIARIDRELAGCAADLALLDPWPSIATAFRQRVLDSLNARYPG